MKETKNDLRYIKTKEGIHAAFRELLLTMSYDKITVKLLTEKARINRKTFYLHYDTLDDLLDELSSEIITGCVCHASQYRIPSDLKEMIYCIYSYWQSLTEEDKKIHSLASSTRKNISFTHQMKLSYNNFEDNFCDGNPKIQRIEMAFIIDTISTFYREWTVYHTITSMDNAVRWAYRIIMEGINGKDK